MNSPVACEGCFLLQRPLPTAAKSSLNKLPNSVERTRARETPVKRYLSANLTVFLKISNPGHEHSNDTSLWQNRVSSTRSDLGVAFEFSATIVALPLLVFSL